MWTARSNKIVFSPVEDGAGKRTPHQLCTAPTYGIIKAKPLPPPPSESTVYSQDSATPGLNVMADFLQDKASGGTHNNKKW